MEGTLTLKEVPAGKRKALVIGATGGIGGAVARALLGKAWQVRAMHRDPARAVAATGLAGIEWVKGDAMHEADVVAASEGTSIIFHGANPPGYRKWRELALPMLAHSLAAARSARARLIFPGNVYNFGPDAWPVVDETSPQNPKTRKGAVRVEMEQMLQQVAGQGTRSLVVRAGDFLWSSGGSWFSVAMVKAGGPVKSISYPGNREAGHAWAYLPDLAETIVQLADIEGQLPAFDVYHFGGHWIEPGIGIAHAVRRVVERPDLPVRRFPWLLVYLGAPVVGFMRELIEMRYLWQVPLRLDNAKLVARLGREPHTPLDEAVRRTLRDMNCLQDSPPLTGAQNRP